MCVCVCVCVYCTTSKVRFFSSSTYRTYAFTVLAYHDTYYNMHKKVHMSMSETISYEVIEKDYKAKYSKEGKDITVILYRYEGDVRLFGSTISRLVCPLGTSISKSCNVRANYGIIRLMQSSFLSSFRMSSTHKLALEIKVRPETSSSREGSRLAGFSFSITSSLRWFDPWSRENGFFS